MYADCHIHMVLDGRDWRAALRRHAQQPEEAYIRSVLSQYRALGFTYLRDGGDRWCVGKRARELASEYGIVYRTPLAPLCRAGHYGSFIGCTYDDMHQFRQLVKNTRRNGGDFIKIMLSGLMDFNRFGVLTDEGRSREEIREAVRIAHGEGFSVMVHANGASTVAWAAEAGVDSVEHGAYLDDRALEAMAAAGTVWVPTLSTIGNLRGTGRFQEGAVSAILASAMENVAKFGEMGGLLAPGSDAGAWAVPHGVLTEYALLEQALGDSTSRILRAGIDKICKKF